MGNTCSSVHLALMGATADAIKGIVRAYGALGFEQSKTPSPDGGKHVIVSHAEADGFLSVYDSDNASLDSGELKDLALAASKVFKTAAVSTSLYDSDTFEFVVFNAGKQVDLVLSNSEEYSGPLKILSGASRARQWSKVFGRPLNARQIAEAAATTSVFADDVVAGLSRLVGLTGGQSQLHFRDLLEGDAARVHHLHFTRKPTAPRAVPAGQIALRDYFDPDNSRMLLVYPASWPMPLREEVRVTWLMLSEGAGFNDGTLAIRVTGPDGLMITGGYMEGSKFHNGQVVGALETAPPENPSATIEERLKSKQFEVTLDPPASGSTTFTARFPVLDIPAKIPARPTQILIVLQLHLTASHVGTWNIDVSVRPASSTGFQHDLPPVRMAAVEQTWLPVVSGLNPKASYETADLAALQPQGAVMLYELQRTQASVLLDRRLTHFAIASNVAIVHGEEQPTLDACRAYLDAWLRPLAEKAGEVRIHAEKRMTERAYVGKTRKTLPVSAFQRDKSWQKLFDAGGNYQTVLATFVPEGAQNPVAGVGFQVGMENHPAQWRQHYEQQLADTLSRMRGRPFERAPAVNTVHVFNWILNHDDCYAYLGTSIGDMKSRIDEFATHDGVLQAWHGQATWRPLFDHADDWQRTVYEDSSVLNWFRGILQTDGGLNACKMSLEWCRNVLRMVTPHMWICRTLFDQVDRAELEAVAEVTGVNDVFRIVLREGRGLDDLELALLPVLPVESARLRKQ
jgi:hypothetical protein